MSANRINDRLLKDAAKVYFQFLTDYGVSQATPSPDGKAVFESIVEKGEIISSSGLHGRRFSLARIMDVVDTETKDTIRIVFKMEMDAEVLKNGK